MQANLVCTSRRPRRETCEESPSPNAADTFEWSVDMTCVEYESTYTPTIASLVQPSFQKSYTQAMRTMSDCNIPGAVAILAPTSRHQSAHAKSQPQSAEDAHATERIPQNDTTTRLTIFRKRMRRRSDSAIRLARLRTHTYNGTCQS